MAIAHTAPSDTDLLDGVVVPPGDCVVPLCHGHQVPQHSLGLHQADPDVRSSQPVEHHLALLYVVLAGPPLGQRNEDFSPFDGQNFRELCGTDDAIVGINHGISMSSMGVDTKIFLALGIVRGEVLPGSPGDSIVHGLLQRPDPGPGGVRHGDHHVGHLEALEQVNLQVHPVILPSPGDGR